MRSVGFALIAASALLAMGMSATPVAAIERAAPTAGTPQQGQCFYHTIKDVKAVSPPKAAVSCTSRHSVEVWRVAQWPYGSDPRKMSSESARKIAESACNLSTFPSDKFNYWAYFVPSVAEWKKGARWIRCDAMIVKMDSNGKITTIYSWVQSLL